MPWLLRWMSATVALWGTLCVADLRGRTSGILLWPLKVLATAVAPVIALTGGAIAALGLKRRDPLVIGAALVGAVAAARYTALVTAQHDGFAETFGVDWPDHIPRSVQERFLSRRWTPLIAAPPKAVHRRDVRYGINPVTGQTLLADLWEPPDAVSRSGLGMIYVHGGAWQLGAKDMGTRPFFRRLANQGHVIMDIDYTLAPMTDVRGMVVDVKRAVIWLKQNAAVWGVNPHRVVLCGGSAGGHLALLAAFSPNDPALQPDGSTVDTSVRGVVAFYPPADFKDVYDDVERGRQRLIRRKRLRPYGHLVEAVLHLAGLVPPHTPIEQAGNYVARLLGVEPDQGDDLYQQLSPTGRVGPHCPPTLLLQGTADIFGMSRSVRRLHRLLRDAGVPAVLVEFPNADHAFDLLLPRIAPAAQAATYDVERFLALMV